MHILAYIKHSNQLTVLTTDRCSIPQYCLQLRSMIPTTRPLGNLGPWRLLLYGLALIPAHNSLFNYTYSPDKMATGYSYNCDAVKAENSEDLNTPVNYGELRIPTLLVTEGIVTLSGGICLGGESPGLVGGYSRTSRRHRGQFTRHRGQLRQEGKRNGCQLQTGE